MNRHPFRWQGLAFGAFFLAVAGNWAVWEQDLLSPDQFSFTLSAVLIVAGVVGVVATFVKPRHAPAPAQPETHIHDDPEENHEQAAHPQP